MKGPDRGVRRVRLALLCIWYMRPVYQGLGMRVSDVRVGQMNIRRTFGVSESASTCYQPH
jgi:hypothetical protein